MLGESRLAFSTILPRPTAVVQDTSVAVAYDSRKDRGKPLRYHALPQCTVLYTAGKRHRTQNRRVVLLAASVAIRIVEASTVALVDPLPEDGVCQLTTRSSSYISHVSCSQLRPGLFHIAAEFPTVGGASSIPTQMGIFTGTNADRRNTAGTVSPVCGCTAASYAGCSIAAKYGFQKRSRYERYSLTLTDIPELCVVDGSRGEHTAAKVRQRLLRVLNLLRAQKEPSTVEPRSALLLGDALHRYHEKSRAGRTLVTRALQRYAIDPHMSMCRVETCLK